MTGTATSDQEAVTARTSDLGKRVLAGIVMLAAALAAWWLGGWLFFVLVGLVGLLAAMEWARLTIATNTKSLMMLMMTVLALVFGLAQAMSWDIAVGVLIAVAFAVMAIAAIRLDRAGFWAGLGLLYVGLPALSIAWMRTLPEPRGAIIVLWFFLVVWSTDIAAYFAGRAFGGPKLAPAISPKKTWSGAIAGLIAAGLAGLAVVAAFALPSATALVIVSIMVSALAQLSDLMESLLKRVFGRKDSGHLIPGHGGVLDRIDSYVLTAPALAFALALPGVGAI